MTFLTEAFIAALVSLGLCHLADKLLDYQPEPVLIFLLWMIMRSYVRIDRLERSVAPAPAPKEPAA